MSDFNALARAEAHEESKNPHEQEYLFDCEVCGEKDCDEDHVCESIRCHGKHCDNKTKLSEVSLDEENGLAYCLKCGAELCDIKTAKEILK